MIFYDNDDAFWIYPLELMQPLHEKRMQNTNQSADFMRSIHSFICKKQQQKSNCYNYNIWAKA